MVRVISESGAYTSVITLAKWSVFYTGAVIPEMIEHLVRMDRIASGKTRMVATQDLVIVVEGLWLDSYTGADRVLFVRADRAKEGVGSLWFARPCQRPELRTALLAANVLPVKSVGGFDQVPIYNDEIAIVESSWGSYGWIVTRADAEKYLKAGLSKDSPGKLRRIKIWHEVHIDQDGKCFPTVRIEGWSESQMLNDATVWNRPSSVYCSTKNQGSCNG